MVHQIIYTSSATSSSTEQDFRYIAKHADENNRNLAVTGIMLYADGVIFQVLEGDKEIVETLYDRIKHDERHSSVMKLIDRDAEAREFSNWSIGFSEMDTAKEDENDVIFALTKTNLAQVMPTEPSAELRVLTDTYVRVGGI